MIAKTGSLSGLKKTEEMRSVENLQRVNQYALVREKNSSVPLFKFIYLFFFFLLLRRFVMISKQRRVLGAHPKIKVLPQALSRVSHSLHLYSCADSFSSKRSTCRRARAKKERRSGAEGNCSTKSTGCAAHAACPIYIIPSSPRCALPRALQRSSMRARAMPGKRGLTRALWRAGGSKTIFKQRYFK